MEPVKQVVMQGKDRDKKLAESFRETFIQDYNDTNAFRELIDSLGTDCVERLIFRLKVEKKVDFYKDYAALKEIATRVKENNLHEVFLKTCEVDDARAWINDNGKWKGLSFEALYSVFSEDEALKPYILV